MKNKESIRRVYDEIHAPDAVFRKVMEMDKKKSNVRNVMKYAAGTVAALAIALVTSNGISYAATGETWISKAIVYINGEATEQEMTWHQSGDTLYGEVEVPAEDGEESYVHVISTENPDGEIKPGDMYIEFEEGYETEGQAESTYTQDAFTAELKQEDGKIFLIAGEEKIDITEDFKDGEAIGTFEFEGLTVKYTVTGSIEKSDISLTCE